MFRVESEKSFCPMVSQSRLGVTTFQHFLADERRDVSDDIGEILTICDEVGTTQFRTIGAAENK